MDLAKPSPALRWFERFALAALVLYLFAHTMPRAWKTLNTDFPNYYISARLVSEHSETSRLYEWTWIQREKDHRAIDIPVLGLMSITPFSTLVMWPIASLPALTAKHIWLLLNLAMLVPLIAMLHRMTGLCYRRIALVFALSLPLHRNLLFGQFYLFLLLLLVTACWACLRKRYFLAGSLIAVAAACKIFPVLLFVLFVPRHCWRVLFAGFVTGLSAIAASIAVFGINLHRIYLFEVLPWTLRGESLSPYIPSSASISTLLHYLFLSEPEWNPHPWHNSPLAYALLQPTLQLLLLAPAILLLHTGTRTHRRFLLEFSAILTASLTISTAPSSYHFVLIAFPICVLATHPFARKPRFWLLALLVIFLGIGFPMSMPSSYIGPAILFFMPRLFFMIVLLLMHYALLLQDPVHRVHWQWPQTAVAALLILAAALGIHSAYRQQALARQDFAYRLPSQPFAFLRDSPQPSAENIRYIALNQDGYTLASTTTQPFPVTGDILSFTTSHTRTLVEAARHPASQIVDLANPQQPLIDNAQSPVLSPLSQDFAYLRDNHGHSQLVSSNNTLTPSTLNIYEASFLSPNLYAFAATQDGNPPGIYLTDATRHNAPLPLGESRYPSLSPDAQWLAYSHFSHGAWNLWLLNLSTGTTLRITDLPCNQIQPAWEPDSKTLLYASDCGRSLWFTAIDRRQIIP